MADDLGYRNDILMFHHTDDSASTLVYLTILRIETTNVYEVGSLYYTSTFDIFTYILPL